MNSISKRSQVIEKTDLAPFFYVNLIFKIIRFFIDENIFSM